MYLMEKTLNHMLKSFKQTHNQFMVKQNLMVKMKLDINPLNSIIIELLGFIHITVITL